MRFRLIAIITAAVAVGAGTATALDLKDITYRTENAGDVVFSHKTHLNKKRPKTAGFNCRACHSTSQRKGSHATMADMERGRSCGACHNGRQAFAVASCTRCHKVRDIAFRIKETGPLTFSHVRHLRTLQCGACHNGIYTTGGSKRVTMAQMEQGKSCGACHNGRKAFALASCGRCHPMRDRLYRPGAGSVAFSHSFHIGMYGCGDCHTGIYRPGKGNRTATMADMEKGASCGACHDSKTAFTVKANCAQCHKVRIERTASLAP